MPRDLEQEAYINLATFRRSGAAVETPVWFTAIGDKLYVFTEAASAKVKRIRATKKIRIAACNAWGGVRGEWSDGHARVVSEPELIDQAYIALRAKYGWQMWLVDLGSRLAGRIHGRAILELALDRSSIRSTVKPDPKEE